MPSVYAGLHLPNKPDEFLTLEQIDFDKDVLHLKQKIAEKCQFEVDKLEVIYNGLALQDDKSLSETLKPDATIHCFQKTKKYTPYEPSDKVTDAGVVDVAQLLFYNIGNIQINVSCRVNILQKILAEYPEFRRNPAALALIRDSVLFNTLHQPEVIKKVAEHYPIIVEAASFIVSTVRKELARFSTSKFSEPATDSTNSSEEENSVGSNERSSRDEESGRSQSETARIRMISRQQLQSALAQIGVGSANSLSNIAQRETSAAASGTSEATSTPLSNSASGERISSDVFRNGLLRALDLLGQREGGSTATASASAQDPIAMDTSEQQEQQSANTSLSDDGALPVLYRSHPYADQLRTMLQMGFLDSEENLNYLNLASGCIEQAVNLLMASMT